MKGLFWPIAIYFGLFSSAGAAEVQPDTNPGRWSDVVEVIVRAPRTTEVVVNARCPAMWRLRRGDSTVYIMPTLTTVTFGMQWDTRCFKRRLKSANALLLQTEMVRVPTDLKLLPGTRVKDVVSPDTYQRYQAAAKRARESASRYDQYRPGWAATFFLRDAYNRHNLVNETYPKRMPLLAKGAGVPVRYVQLFDGGYEGRNSRNFLDAVGDEACMNAVLDRLDHTYDKLPAMIEAWRTSDIRTVLNLFPEENESCFPARSDGLAIRRENQRRWAEAINVALHTPGKTIVAMPMSWFLYRDGALDQIRQDNEVMVTLPEGMENEDL